MEDLARRIDDHIEREEKAIEEVRSMLSVIKDNHLAHIEPAVKALEADVDWLKRITLIAMGAAISGMVGIFYQIVIRR